MRRRDFITLFSGVRRFLVSSQSSKALDRTWTLRRFHPGVSSGE